MLARDKTLTKFRDGRFSQLAAQPGRMERGAKDGIDSRKQSGKVKGSRQGLKTRSKG